MADSPSTSEVVSQAKVFNELPGDIQTKLAESAKVQTFQAGDVIIQSGGEGDTLFLIFSGSARVEVEGAGKTIQVASLGAGDFCGEVAAVFQQRRSATVIADGEVVAAAVEGDALRTVLEAVPEFKETLEQTGLHRIEEDIDAYLSE